jgi:hypothetical protein
MISAIFLLACIVGMMVSLLRLLEWMMEEVLMTRSWALENGTGESSWWRMRGLRRAERRRWKYGRYYEI